MKASSPKDTDVTTIEHKKEVHWKTKENISEIPDDASNTSNTSDEVDEDNENITTFEYEQEVSTHNNFCYHSTMPSPKDESKTMLRNEASRDSPPWSGCSSGSSPKA